MSEPRIAAIVRADAGGLGTLAREFSAQLGFHRTLSLAYRLERFDDKFFGGPTNRVVPRSQQIAQTDAEWLLDGADAVLSFETWYSPEVPMLARKLGVKTVLVPMHEQTPLGGIANSFTDLVLCPHELCRREMEITPAFRDARKVLLPVPFDLEPLKFRRRERARTFLHFAHFDRNSTHEVIAAWRQVKGDARLIVKCLSDVPEPRDERITIDRECHRDYWHLWNHTTADVLLHPHRFDGLSLPLQHAAASGMPVMSTRFWPFCHTDRLRLVGPAEPDLIERYKSDGTAMLPPSSDRRAIEPHAMRRMVIGRPILAFDVLPEAIAAAVDGVYDSDVSEASIEGRQWAEARSFDVFRGAWLEEIAA